MNHPNEYVVLPCIMNHPNEYVVLPCIMTHPKEDVVLQSIMTHPKEDVVLQYMYSIKFFLAILCDYCIQSYSLKYHSTLTRDHLTDCIPIDSVFFLIDSFDFLIAFCD